MRIITRTPLSQPSHEIEIRRPINLERISVELINYESIVAVCGELVGDQLTVLPDSYHVGEEEDGGFGFGGGWRGGFGDVDFCGADLGGFACWLAAV
jgi:hypothetical protein